ncbi:MAG: hypothetical protein OXU79_05000 [Gemmatimonadota bacterium]|nr:hypothetical protein [Gemmatimonadota bacterium]
MKRNNGSRRPANRARGSSAAILLAFAAGMAMLTWVVPAAAESPDSAAVDSVREIRPARGAMLRSLALPGWGQFYNRRPIKGSLIAFAQVSSTAAFFVRRNQLKSRPSVDATPERNIFLYTTIGLILFSMGDAYVDAHLDQVDWGEPHGSGEEGLEFRLRFRIRF